MVLQSPVTRALQRVIGARGAVKAAWFVIFWQVTTSQTPFSKSSNKQRVGVTRAPPFRVSG